MTDAVAESIDMGEEELDTARLLVENGRYAAAASRAYYAMFYAAEALLLSRGLFFPRHAAVIEAFRSHFTAPGLLQAELHRELSRAFALRLSGDYPLTRRGTKRPARVTKEQAEQATTSARHFLAAAREFLSRSQQGESAPPA